MTRKMITYMSYFQTRCPIQAGSHAWPGNGDIKSMKNNAEILDFLHTSIMKITSTMSHRVIDTPGYFDQGKVFFDHESPGHWYTGLLEFPLNTFQHLWISQNIYLPDFTATMIYDSSLSLGFNTHHDYRVTSQFCSGLSIDGKDKLKSQDSA